MPKNPKDLLGIQVDLLVHKCSVENTNFTWLEKEDDIMWTVWYVLQDLTRMITVISWP